MYTSENKSNTDRTCSLTVQIDWCQGASLTCIDGTGTGRESVAASKLPRSARTIRVEEIRRDDFRRMKVLDLDGSSGGSGSSMCTGWRSPPLFSIIERITVARPATRHLSGLSAIAICL